MGSSNISHAALHEGLEWNVRLSQVNAADLVRQVDVVFDSYWDDPQFEDYDQTGSPRPSVSKGGAAVRALTCSLFPSGSTFAPYFYQEAILERLAVERERHGHHHNLLVAATGTGKTVIAAFDYKALRAGLGKARLLFVAHRREILEQSRNVFAAVLKERGFGELMVGGERPMRGDHVFASIQSLSNVRLDTIAPDFYDVVIVDEFHHAAAPTYRRILEHLKPPAESLGMTATPERTDEVDVTHSFDGRIAAELRLWDGAPSSNCSARFNTSGWMMTSTSTTSKSLARTRL